MGAPKTAIQPTRNEDYAEWYQQVIKAADLAENSPVRGCMVIKPWGYGIWENIQRQLDRRFKETGHENAYFPLFIPLSYLQKEAEHVSGFAKECAVVTHHRLELNSEGKLVPTGELEEPLIVRPTSETIIGELYAKWVQSYRDLPILINQWANVVRWEMRTRLFLRTAEFLWQEGHTAHATETEAREETLKMLEVYREFAENVLAIPVRVGEKSEGERFPGAVATYCIEAMMQDRKALQAGTSHFLGQNFAKASQIRFLDQSGELQYAWTTSWGVSTRLIGGMIMTHSDDNGLVVPPRAAPRQIVILPVIPKEEHRERVLAFCEQLEKRISALYYYGEPVRVTLDKRDIRGGDKMWGWIKKGIPLTIEVGPRDLDSNQVFVGRRDRDPKDKQSYGVDQFLAELPQLLDSIQNGLLERARQFRDSHTRELNSKEEVYAWFTPQNKERPEIHGGFAMVHWAGGEAEEELLKKDLNVTVRCIPLDEEAVPGVCPFTGKPSPRRVLLAKSY
jgi:prolyl-tRNA synthetase